MFQHWLDPHVLFVNWVKYTFLNAFNDPKKCLTWIRYDDGLCEC